GADASVPVIKVYTPTTASSYATTASSIVLGGTVSDDRGIAQVTWSNSAGGTGIAFGTTGWSTPSVPLVVGVNVITVTAKDAAGNAAMATTTVTRSSEPNPVLPRGPLPTGSNPGVTTQTQNSTAAPVPAVVEPQPAPVTQPPLPRASVSMPPPVMPFAPVTSTATSSKASDLRTDAPASKPDEQAPPVVRILSPTSAAQLTTTSAAIGMSGTATHASGIALVRWNTDRGDSGVAQGTSRWSIPSVRLKSGITTVTVTAVSVGGDSA